MSLLVASTLSDRSRSAYVTDLNGNPVMQVTENAPQIPNPTQAGHLACIRTAQLYIGLNLTALVVEPLVGP